MARFDVYRNPGSHSSSTPYLLDAQSDLLSGLDTQMVIPLRSLAYFPDVHLPEDLTPTFKIEGVEVLLETPKMGAVPSRILKEPVANLANEHSRILAALDFLFQGY